ncbi:MAG: hypothetical protein AAF529_09485 [Pseudomonadota bacterium]
MNNFFRPFRKLMLRDGVIGLSTATLWLLRDGSAWQNYLTGGLTGLCFLLLHEWGHLFGAARKQAVVYPAPLWGPFLFDADSQANNREQFLSLSVWGFYVTGLMLLVFLAFMPWDQTAGRIAWYAALTLSALTVVIEFPIAWRVYRHGSIPPVEIYRNALRSKN